MLSIEKLEEQRLFFQKGKGKVLNFLKYHRSIYKEISLDYVMENINTPNSRKHKLMKIPNKGDLVIRRIIRTITNLKGISLYDYQLDFVKVVLPTLFKYIYRDEWNKDRVDILARHGMKDIYDEVFFNSARRMGKTITLAYTCLSVMVNVEKDFHRPYTIAVFATTKDASKRFVDECELGWKNIDKNNEFYYERKASEIKITKKNDQSDVRVMTSYCGSGPVSITNNKKQGIGGIRAG